jgi:hypothetical protein
MEAAMFAAESKGDSGLRGRGFSIKLNIGSSSKVGLKDDDLLGGAEEDMLAMAGGIDEFEKQMGLVSFRDTLLFQDEEST